AECATAQSYTSAFSITMDRAWDATQSSINLTVSIQATANFNAVGNLVFRTVMVERLIQFTTAPGSNNETEFHDAAIKSFPTLQGGVAMTSNWVTGQTQTFTLNCPLPAYTRKKEEVAFVGFIQDDGNRKVAQAVRVQKQGIGLNDAEIVSMSAAPNIVCANASVPRIIVMRNNGANAITALTLTPYVNAAAQTPVTWSGTLSNGAYQTFTLPSYTPIVGGGQTLGCKITGVSGGDSNLLNNDTTVSFYSDLSATNLQVSEGFAGTFPPGNWGIMNPDEAVTWTKSNAAGGFGLSSESAFYNGIYNDRGDVDDLILAPLDLTGSAVPVMTFDVAHARRFYRSDTLQVLASADCGNTWTLLYQKQDSILSTSQFIAVASSFTPAANEWRTETVNMPGFNQPNVLVKFRIKNDAGNNVYIDNVNVNQSQPANVSVKSQRFESSAVSIYPNPSNGLVYAVIDVKDVSLATVSLFNTSGQLLLFKETQINTKENIITLDLKEFPAGLYQLVVSTNNQTVVKKLSLVK
ncbi:MAG: T9SS type A sorting domain-containing protein, partial [Bacteroidia bacterium]